MGLLKSSMRCRRNPEGLADAFMVGEEFIGDAELHWYWEIIFFMGKIFQSIEGEINGKKALRFSDIT